MKIKTYFGLDKLEITYRLTNDAINLLNGDEIDFIDFKLKKNYSNTKYKICYDIITPNVVNNKIEFINWGKIYYGSFDYFKQQLYISVNNQILYSNDLGFLYFISETLNLEYMNINKIDVSFDTNCNPISKFLKILKDENFTFVILNKKIKDMKQEIDDIITINKGTRENLNKYKSIYIQNKERGLSLVAYDKLKEIEDNNFEKEYILNKLNFKPIYRLEIRTLQHILKDTLLKLNISNEDLYYNLLDKEYLFLLYNNLLNRIIRINFNNKSYNLINILFNI